ncbi:hypothetical protein I317_02954 [Kwoniella heveanensis CBS 569]|nr:hypothetical protein I317_02954 [Kwoniella heveanensis CBS 569]
MSWKHTHGILASGPPSSTLPPSTSAASSSSSSSSLPVGQRIRPNSNLQTPYQRETAFAKHYGVDKDALATEERNRKSEWDVVREHHRFVRDGDDDANGATTSATTWEERVARSYESKLFKEFALIDLKHYKSKRLALRWRTAPEVISGIGESTCASLRCQYHQPPQASSSAPGAGAAPLTASNLRFRDPDDIDAESSVRSSTRHTRRGRDRVDLDLDLDLDEIERVMPPLRSFELPFVYAEAGQRKETLVKVRLCPSCQRKLTWKPDSASTSNAKSGSILDDRGTAERRGEKKVRSSRESERERDRRRSKGKGRVSSEEDSESESGEANVPTMKGKRMSVGMEIDHIGVLLTSSEIEIGIELERKIQIEIGIRTSLGQETGANMKTGHGRSEIEVMMSGYMRIEGVKGSEVRGEHQVVGGIFSVYTAVVHAADLEIMTCSL